MVRIQLSARHLLLAAGALPAMWLLLKLWGVILLAGVALLLAAALMPYVDFLTRRTGRRSLAVVLVVLSVLGAAAALTAMLAPPLVRQGQDLWNQWPQLQERAARFAGDRGWEGLRDDINQFEPSELVGPHLVDAGLTAIDVGLTVFTVFVLTAYLLLDARRLERFVYFSTPRDWHRHIRALLPALQRVVGGYIRGQAITSAAIAVFAFVTLTLVGVPNPLAFAALAAILDVVPMVGALLLITPMTLAALAVSPTAAVIVLSLNLVYQQFEDRVLTPRVYGATMRLPMIAVMLALLAGNELRGMMGVLIALPVAAVARVVIEYFAAARLSEPLEVVIPAAPPDQLFAPDAPAAATAPAGSPATRPRAARPTSTHRALPVRRQAAPARRRVRRVA